MKDYDVLRTIGELAMFFGITGGVFMALFSWGQGSAFMGVLYGVGLAVAGTTQWALFSTVSTIAKTLISISEVGEARK